MNGTGGLPSELASLSMEEKRALLKKLVQQSAPQPISRHSEEEKTRGLPLSHAQERLWIIEQIAPGSAAYNITLPLRISGLLDIDALRRALTHLVSRQEVLRSRYVLLDGCAMQQLREAEAIEIPIRKLPENAEVEKVLQEACMREAETPFDLNHDLLFRGQLIAISELDHLLLFTAHHLVFDGHSIEVLFRELASLYAATQQGCPPALPPLPLQYADFAAWQRSRESSDLNFWVDHLKNIEPLRLCRRDAGISSLEGAMHRHHFEASQVAGLRALAETAGCTMFMAGLALYASLLFRYTNQSDLVLGMPVSQRSRRDLEKLLGFFVNTLPVRLQFTPESSFRDLLRCCRDATLIALEHQDTPFEQMVTALNPTRDWSGNPIFQTMFSSQARPPAGFKLGEATARLQEFPLTRVRFDLEWHLWESPGQLELLIFHDLSRFDHAFATNMARCTTRLLRAMLDTPDDPISTLPMLDDDALNRLLHEWNPSADCNFQGVNLVNRFAVVCAAHPQRVAVRDSNEAHTYAALEQLADRVAHALQALSPLPGAIIALPACHDFHFIAGVLGILKAGCAYLPVDPDWPRERQQEILQDAGALAVLGGAMGLDVPVVSWDALPEAAAPLPPSGTEGDDLACVFYTSGSSGKPKGVCVTHRNVARLVLATNYIDISSDDCIAFASNPAFDAATFEIWGALLHGASLQCIPRDVLLAPQAFESALRGKGVTILFLTTALFNALSSPPFQGFRHLRYLLFGGEQCNVDAVRRVLRHQRPQHLVHVYGPTETTTFATFFEVDSVPQGALTIPIGRAIAHSTCYLLNAALQPVPPGVEAELYLGGEGVARGYLHRPDLTAERFLADPFSSRPGAQMYRTGDLARWNGEGQLIFLGRTDRQLKIRGHRIEPGEIERSIAAIDGVKQVAVLPRARDGQPLALHAFVALQDRSFPAQERVRARLRESLPAHMIPERWTFLDTLPLTPNGKINAGALDALSEAAAETTMEALTDCEEQLAEIWRGMLGIEKLRRRQDFFELGGNSLLVVQMLLAVQRRFEVVVPPHLFLATPTLECLAKIVAPEVESSADAQEEQLQHPAIVPLKLGGDRPPFYFIAPAGGIVTPYYALAARMPDDQPAYGMQDPSLNPELPLLRRVEDLAASHVKSLKAFQPRGPYFFGGWSYGGLVAYEMARLLTTAGEQVGLAVLWDAHGSYQWRPGAGSLPARITHRLAQQRQILAEVPDIIRHLLEGLYLRAHFNHETRADSPAPALRSFLHRLYAGMLFLSASDAEQVRGNRALSLHRLPTVRRGLRLLFLNERACRRFRAKPSETGLLLFRATQQPDALEVGTDPTLGWKRHTRGDVRVIDVPGHHTGLFKNESLDIMALAFVAALRDAQAAATRQDPGPGPAS